jgi:aminotransferase EvaB
MTALFDDSLSPNSQLQDQIDAAALRVSPAVGTSSVRKHAFEREFAAYHGVAHAVRVVSGTNAIELALRAAGIGAGDEVITVERFNAYRSS